MSQQQTTTSGISFLGMLGILFIGLKLTGYVTWSWFYVTMPLWIGLAIFVAAVLLFIVGWIMLKLWIVTLKFWQRRD